jgi:hypothetical protein
LGIGHDGVAATLGPVLGIGHDGVAATLGPVLGIGHDGVAAIFGPVLGIGHDGVAANFGPVLGIGHDGVAAEQTVAATTAPSAKTDNLNELERISLTLLAKRLLAVHPESNPHGGRNLQQK